MMCDHRCDVALAGIQQIGNVRDDILAWDTSFASHVRRVRSILLRCHEYGITLNNRKFVFAQPATDFCG